MADVVVISGAGGGIGRALAHAWRARGAKLVLLDLDRVSEPAGPEVLAIACDVTDPDACHAAIAAALDRFGRVDVVVSNAGITHRSLFADTDPAVIRRVVEVNFFGSVNLTTAALPALRNSGGRIVVMSSVAGFAPLVGRTGYAASKHALHGFFDTLREELRGEVGVTMVCPAFVDTPLRHNALAGDGRPVAGRGVVAGPMLTPEAVAEAVVDATLRERRTVVLSAVGKASWWLSRLFPRAYAAIMRRSQGSEFSVASGSTIH